MLNRKGRRERKGVKERGKEEEKGRKRVKKLQRGSEGREDGGKEWRIKEKRLRDFIPNLNYKRNLS